MQAIVRPLAALLAELVEADVKGEAVREQLLILIFKMLFLSYVSSRLNSRAWLVVDHSEPGHIDSRGRQFIYP